MKIVVLDANAYWTEQLFSRCGRFAEVLLLKPRELRAHRALTGSLREDRTARLVGDQVWEQRLSMPPTWMNGLWAWSQYRLTRVIRAFADAKPLTLIITYPQYRSLLTALRPTRSVYYNFDDYRGNWPRYRSRVPQWEAATVEAADLTICIAAHRVTVLREQHPAKRDRIHHLPLGVSPEVMAVVFSDQAPKHEKSAPVAGYIGALNYRFDFPFLVDVAARLPDVQFVLGGRVQEDGDSMWRAGLARARQQPNVKFLGWVAHARLGEHLACFDVLLMPYSKCNFNTNACPAKLWDYMGTGRPIVASTANPETLLWREVVHVGADAEEFAQLIQDALSNNNPAQRRRRLEIAREHTWERLSTRVLDLIQVER